MHTAYPLAPLYNGERRSPERLCQGADPRPRPRLRAKEEEAKTCVSSLNRTILWVSFQKKQATTKLSIDVMAYLSTLRATKRRQLQKFMISAK